jgi:hypothetical protein
MDKRALADFKIVYFFHACFLPKPFLEPAPGFFCVVGSLIFGMRQSKSCRRYKLTMLPGLAEISRMKVAVLFSIPMTTSGDVCWRWRSIDGKTDSKQSFSSYEDCLENAKTNGYLYHLVPSSGGKPRDTAIAGKSGATKR